MRPCSSEAQPCLGIVGSSPFCRWSMKKSSDWRQRLDWHDGTAHEFCSNIWVWVNIADPMTKDQSLCFPSHYPKQKKVNVDPYLDHLWFMIICNLLQSWNRAVLLWARPVAYFWAASLKDATLRDLSKLSTKQSVPWEKNKEPLKHSQFIGP